MQPPCWERFNNPMTTRMTNLRRIAPAHMARRRGTILVTTIAICLTLAAVVMVLVRSMAVEARASANTAAAVQAETIETGAEEYLKALLNVNNVAVMDPNTFTQDYFAGVPVGNTGWFFILRPVYDDPNMPLYGLVDECSKVDINFATGNGATRNAGVVYNQLLMLPGMTEDVAGAIIDWQDGEDGPYNGLGAESDVYTSMSPAYYCKNAPFEAVEELMMVRGMVHTALWGDGSAGPLGVESGTIGSSRPVQGLNGGLSPRGWYDLLTVHAYSAPAAGGGGGGGGGGAATVGRGLININTAPPEVLYTMGLEDADVQSIIGTRSQMGAFGLTDTSWVQGAVSSGNINNLITGQSYRYSADILAVAGNGRAFKRVRIVIDAQTTPVSIIYRRDFTDQGWPLDPQLLQNIIAGQYADSLASGSTMGAFR